MEQSLESKIKENGVYSKLESMLRAEMFNTLDNQPTKVEATPETNMINELIMEYMKFNNYGYSMSVFEKEAGAKFRSRKDLCNDLKLQVEDSKMYQD